MPSNDGLCNGGGSGRLSGATGLLPSLPSSSPVFELLSSEHCFHPSTLGNLTEAASSQAGDAHTLQLQWPKTSAL
eukprot:4213709-Pleurochrysis_carterae.AAC.1